MSESDSTDSDSDYLAKMDLLSDKAVNTILSNTLLIFDLGEVLYLASPAVERTMPDDFRWLRVRCGPENGAGICQVSPIPFEDLVRASQY